MPGMKKVAYDNSKPSLDVPRGKIANPKTSSRTTKPKPTPSPSTFAQKNKAAEAELKRLMKAGKVKDIAKTRSQIAKKYGVSPNGFTN